MKLDKEHTKWLQIRLAGSGLALLFLCWVAQWAFGDMAVTVSEFYGVLLALAWLGYVAILAADVIKDQRNTLGLKPHWTDSEIDELENRVAALEKQLDTVD